MPCSVPENATRATRSKRKVDAVPKKTTSTRTRVALAPVNME